MSHNRKAPSVILDPNQVRIPSALARRDFLKQVGQTGAAAAVAAHALKNTAWAFGSQRFKLGVASGDPHASGFSLWTRIAPEPLMPGGGLNQERVLVQYEVALDPEMRQVMRRGRTVAARSWGYNVKVDLFGLRPDRWYWYRFICEGENNYAGLIPENGQDPFAFKARRAAAYRAYWEAMPMRRLSGPRRERLRLHRQIHFGSLASFYVLDTRQFRSDQPCDPTDP